MSAKPPPAFPPGEGRQVLLVEDETRLREMLTRAIHEMGFTPTAVAQAEPALRLMDSRPFDVLIVDLNLPGMGGLEFLEQVHARWPTTQAIVLTGFGDLDAAKQAIDILAILEEKTRGNLDDGEAKLLQSLLYDLRVAYVDAQKKK